MNENKFLNEEKYQKTEKSITIIAIIILLVGLCIGGYLIYNGVAKPKTSNVDVLEGKLEQKKKELENKGIVYDSFAKYSDGEKYELKIITDALDPSFNNCAFDEYKNNSITKEYCNAKNSTGEFASTTSIMFGAFICIATCMIAGIILMIAKRRKILAFTAQQTIPIAKEGINEMAPTFGNVAKEISKGIKEGISEDKK